MERERLVGRVEGQVGHAELGQGEQAGQGGGVGGVDRQRGGGVYWT